MAAQENLTIMHSKFGLLLRALYSATTSFFILLVRAATLGTDGVCLGGGRGRGGGNQIAAWKFPSLVRSEHSPLIVLRHFLRLRDL